jgi:hypothetical protein
MALFGECYEIVKLLIFKLTAKNGYFISLSLFPLTCKLESKLLVKIFVRIMGLCHDLFIF